jgi:hypothetical protein
MGLFGHRQFPIAVLKADRSRGQCQQAGDDPQQRGFARSVGSGNGQRLAGSGCKIELREHLPAAPHAFDAASQEPHLPFRGLPE